MAVSKVLYAVRIPADLKRLIDAAAKSGGVNTSDLVIAALWKYLDAGGSQSIARHMKESPGQDLDSGQVTGSGTKPDTQRLRDIWAGKIDIMIPSDGTPEPILCSYREWFEGEQWACGLPVHGPKIKHTRGTVVS
jgi:hypothetical protein